MCIRSVLYFCLTRSLDAARLKFRQAIARKHHVPVFWPGTPLFWGSIVNAAADGKRLRAIDALQRSEQLGRARGKLPNYAAWRPR
jgi:hypothetical protein